MRGQHWHNKLFALEISNPSNIRQELLNVRDQKMATRFYFYAKIKQLRYDACLVNLKDEFDLSPNAIIKRLEKQETFIKGLITNKTGVDVLKQKYPFYNWH